MPPKGNRLSDEPQNGVPGSENEKEKSNEIEGNEVVASLQEELKNKEKAIEDLQGLIFKLQEASQQQASDKPKKSDIDIATLRQQVESLTTQLTALSQQRAVTTPQGARVLFREPVASDLQEDSVTFTARSVLYVVGSYRDHRGLEVIPPHRLITFSYAASDVRKDGREEEIRNYSQYTTKLKTEIDFLRNHPHYGITFSENLHNMMQEDVLDIRFKANAASQLAALPPEAIFERAMEYKIPNANQKSADQLRQLLVEIMSSEFKQAEKDMQAEATKRRVMALASITAKEE